MVLCVNGGASLLHVELELVFVIGETAGAAWRAVAAAVVRIRGRRMMVVMRLLLRVLMVRRL